jgi:hypothetical protein
MAEPQKKIRWTNAWADARELVWAHRHRLILGAVLMIVNQAMGLVLPASTKYLIDRERPHRSALENCTGSGRRNACTGMNVFQPVSGLGRGSPTRDYGDAQESPGADFSMANQLLRFDANRQAHRPDHERCRGHT